jgi:CrcB protein
MTRLLIIGCGGFCGAIARYWMTLWVQRRLQSTVPVGTMAVNVLGCFLLGFLMAYVDRRPATSAELQLFVKVGLLGAFTTFSTLGYETVQLFQDGELQDGLVSLAGNFVLGLVAVVLGAGLARLVVAG